MSKWLMIVMAVALVWVVSLGAGCKPSEEPKEEPYVEVVAPAAEEAATPAPVAETTEETQPAPEVAVESKPGEMMVFDFETDAHVKCWEVEEEIADRVALSVSTDHATQGKRSLKMVLKPHQWPGINTTKLPRDFSAFKELKFDVIAERDANVNVRIDDDDSTSYETRYQLGGTDVFKGKNTVTILTIDLGGRIDLKRIKAMFIFSGGVEEDLTLYIDNVRLVK